MEIFIPSMGRADMQHTLKELMGASPYPISVVVTEDEFSEYCGALPPGASIHSVPRFFQGIAATRQFIMSTLATSDHVVMMDDDLSFAVRRTDEPDKFRTATKDDIRWMLQQLHALLHRYAHVSVAMREGANRRTDDVITCTRVARVIGYDRNVFLAEGADFRNSIVQDDFEVTLHLLTRGYKNGVLNSFVQNQRGSGTAGGASAYRTMDVQKRSCELLASRYPQFVKPVVKKTKTAWGGQERTDVIVQWKAAHQSGVNRYGDR